MFQFRVYQFQVSSSTVSSQFIGFKCIGFKFNSLNFSCPELESRRFRISRELIRQVQVSADDEVLNAIRLSPNPARNTICGEIPPGVYVQVYDVAGRHVDMSHTAGRFDMSGLNDGLYYFVIRRQGNANKVVRVVKKGGG